jgi:hypothetical protein
LIQCPYLRIRSRPQQDHNPLSKESIAWITNLSKPPALFAGRRIPKTTILYAGAARIGHPTSDPQKDAVPILAIHLPC